MYCTNCGCLQDEKAVFCSDCGAKINVTPAGNSPSKQQPSNTDSADSAAQSRNPLRSCVSVIILIVIVLALFGSCGTSKSEVISAARSIVSDNLKAPSTATFSNETIVDEDNYGRYCVYLSVDAQNSFGSYIRNNYYVVLRIDGDMYYWSQYFAVHSVDSQNSYDEEFIKNINNWGNPPTD